MIFGRSGRAHGSQIQILLILNPSNYFNQEKYLIWKLSNLGNRFCFKCARQQILKIRLINLGIVEYGINIYRKA